VHGDFLGVDPAGGLIQLCDDGTRFVPCRSRKATNRDGAQPPPGEGAVNRDDSIATTRAGQIVFELERRQRAPVAE
jgi:hypothetical protein